VPFNNEIQRQAASVSVRAKVRDLNMIAYTIAAEIWVNADGAGKKLPAHGPLASPDARREPDPSEAVVVVATEGTTVCGRTYQIERDKQGRVRNTSGHRHATKSVDTACPFSMKNVSTRCPSEEGLTAISHGQNQFDIAPAPVKMTSENALVLDSLCD
jgi:hypothetical protein